MYAPLRADEAGLGVLPVAVATTAAKIASSLPVIGGLFNSHPKDAGRLQSNAKYYSECAAGDADACVALKYMSGRFGLTKTGRYCNQGGCSGWATQSTKDDAYAKCQSLPNCIGAPAVPVASSASTPVDVPQYSAPPSSPSNGVSPWLIGAGALAVLLLAKR